MAVFVWTGVTNNNWSTGTNWNVGGVPQISPPTIADDVAIGTGTGATNVNITITAGSVCRSIDFTGYTGQATGASSSFCSIGDATAGAGNIALKFSTGMTWASSSSTTAFQFISTSTTQQTITFAGKTNLSRININGAGSRYVLADSMTLTDSFTLSQGEFDTGSQTVTTLTAIGNGSSTKSFLMGTTNWHLTSTAATTIWNFNATGTTWSGSSATVTIDNTSTSTRTITGAIYSDPTINVGTLDYSLAGSTGQLTMAAGNFNVLKFSDASNARTLAFSTNTTTINEWSQVFGNVSNNIVIASTVGGTQRTIDTNGTTQETINRATISDIKVATPYKLYATNSTDGGGNVNIGFSAAPSSPFIRQSSFVHNGSGTSSSNTLTYAPVAGQLLTYQIAFAGDPGTFTPPSGFTLAKAANNSTSAYGKLYYKVANGTETTITSSWVNSVFSDAMVLGISGFNGTPTLDTTDSNASAGNVTSLSTGSGATNSANPGVSIAIIAANSMGVSVATVPTNSYEESYNTFQGTGSVLKLAILPLNSNASRSTTITWTTARTAEALLVNFIDITVWLKNLADTTTESDAIVNSVVKKASDTSTPSDSLIKAMGKLFADTGTPSDAVSKQLAKYLSDSAAVNDSMMKAIVKHLADTGATSDHFDISNGSTPQNYVVYLADAATAQDEICFHINGSNVWYDKRGSNWYQRDTTSWYEANQC